MKKIGLFLLIFSVFTLTNAQENFISVNGQSISKKDFEKKFSQNIEVEGWEQAINTYIDAELLLQAAQKKQLDTTKVYQKFSGVAKADLFNEYQYPTKKKDSLLKLFAQRQQIQKKVAYFQFPIENEASVESRNSAKEKAEELKKVVCQQKNSPAEKQYFKDNNTQPLYVSSLDFPLEIENTIYATPKGQCSSIQKYNRNFYFVKVLDERESPFLYTYSHLMVKEKSKIDSIYNLLNNGLDYFEAVKRYSDDKTTKNKNGLVNSLTASVPDEFFTVLNQLDYRTYSAPVESNDGWHILFLARKQSCENTEECIKFLKEKIAKERWDFLLEQDRENEVDNRLKYSTNQQALDEVMNLITPDYFMNDKIIGLNSDKDIYTSPYGAFTQQNLIDAFVEAKNQLPKNSDVSILKSDIFNRIVRNWKYSHYMTNFVEFNPKLKEQIKQVDREMLVNYFIEKFIYQKAMADSLGMKSYLNQNLNDYTWPTRYQTNLYVCKDKEVQNKVVQFLEQGKTKEEIEAYYRSIPTENHSPWLYVQSGKIPKENDVLPKQTQYKIGVQPISTQHKNYVVQITQEIPPSPMTVTEAGTVLQEAYKNYIFLQTLSELRKNAVIKINR